MSIRKLVVAVALLALPLAAAAEAAAAEEAPVDCHQAALVGPVALQPVPGARLAAAGEVVLADGTRLADGHPVPAGRALQHGVVRNVGDAPVAVEVGGGETVHLAPKATIAVTTAAGLPNERICVCACTCGSSDVQIRCDTLQTDCSTLDKKDCVTDGGGMSTLDQCKKIFVKPGAAG